MQLAQKADPFEVTHGRVLRIAIPMTLAYLSVPLVGIADTAVIGQLGNAALLGGVALGSIALDLLFMTCNFLRSGTTGLTAQAMGRRDHVEEVAIGWRALLLALIIGALAIGLGPLFLEAARAFLGGSSEVQAAMSVYFGVRLLGAPFTLANFAILGSILGLGRAGLGLGIQTFLNGLNIALTAWFVLGLEMGIAGAAWATVVAEAATCIVGLAWLFVRTRRLGWPGWPVIVQRDAFKAMLSLNRDIMIRSFALLFAFTYFARIGAKQGDVVLAANAILEKFFLVGGYFLDGLATAAEQLAGRALGAKKKEAFARAVKLTVIWGAAMALILAAIYAVFGTQLIGLMTTSEDVRSVAGAYLIYAAITPLAGVLAFQMDGVFIGATWSRDMRNMMLISLAVYVAAIWALVPALGNDGLWLALLIFLGMRGITLGWLYPRRMETSFAGT